jgi:hypothetical protein
MGLDDVANRLAAELGFLLVGGQDTSQDVFETQEELGKQLDWPPSLYLFKVGAPFSRGPCRPTAEGSLFLLR